MAVTRSISAANKNKNRLAEMLQNDIFGSAANRQQFEDYVLSVEGKQDLLRLSDEDFVKLSEYTLSSIDGRENQQSTYSTPMIECLLAQDIPNKLPSQDAKDNLGHMFLSAMGQTYEDDSFTLIAVLPDALMIRMLNVVIDINPGGIIYKPDYAGNLLLHKVMKLQQMTGGDGMPMEILIRVYNYFPDAVKHKNDQGYLPLHYLIDYFYRPTILKFQWSQFILSKYVAAAGVAIGDEVNLPLLILAGFSIEWMYQDGYDEEIALGLLRDVHDAYPEAVYVCNINSEYPLHKACKEQFCDTPIVALFLLEKFPQAAFEVDDDGFTPFEYVSLHNTTEVDISLFVQGLRESRRLIEIIKEMRDERTGNNLLHIFSERGRPCSRRRSKDKDYSKLYHELISLFPRLTLERSFNGIIPLQARLENTGLADTRLFEDIQMLVDATLTSVGEGQVEESHHFILNLMETLREERTGNNLLHIFSKCGKRSNKELYYQLIQNFPQLTLEANLNGDLPLHVRLRRGTNNNSFSRDTTTLIEAMDEVIDFRHPDPLVTLHDGLLPFMIAACRPKPRVSCIFFLLQRFVAKRGTLFDIYRKEEGRESKRQRLSK